MFKTKTEKKGYWSKKGNDHKLGRSLVVILDFERTLKEKAEKEERGKSEKNLYFMDGFF